MHATTTTTATTKKSSIGRLAAHLALAAAAGLGALTLGAGPAAAQVDPNYHDVLQQRDGRLQKVGAVFMPDKVDRTNYVEHWVLYPGYVYPSATNRVAMTVQPARSDIDTEAEFFAQRFPEGSRYVKVFASESEVVPSIGLPAVRDLLPATNSSSAGLPLAGAWAWMLGGAGAALSALDLRRRHRR